MQVKAFELERWQSVWENRVELNISESGVLPLTTAELVGDSGALGTIMNVRQGYPQTNGSEELRSRIAGLYAGADASKVLVTCGASEANFVTTWALLEPADEVVFMTPNYMQIAGLAAAFGATVKPLCLKEGRRWGIDPHDLKAAVTGKTRLIAICNPNNPTGAVLDVETREAIAGAAAKAGAWILADEVYRGAEFDGGMTPSFWGSYERVICTGGLSKAYGLPGLRLGWIVGPGEFVERLWGYHDYTSIAPTVLTDRLACVALEPRRRNWILGRTRKMLKQNYAVLSNWLDSHGDRFSHIPPKAGAIAWIGLREGESSAQIARELLERKSLLVVPGEQFGMDSYLRIGFGGETEQLRQALSRFDEWLAERG
ncbi:MAG TPA: aminotransferase class I/II-fold pyridoxal phosphate-dependent enzyme [Candidatus Acidoferrales bacterium]|nr:aminotransferase class I/II-fold pyridoxal phosphate-dependent enzyme [Candidatus Acidoferrales bacterium]